MGYSEVRDYQKIKDTLASSEKSEVSTSVMAEFQARGSIPGAYKQIWSIYEKRLKAYKQRKATAGNRAYENAPGEKLLARSFPPGLPSRTSNTARRRFGLPSPEGGVPLSSHG